MTSKICFIYTTWPNKRSAKAAAKKLLDERLVACANIFGGAITSLYRWQGQVRQSVETVMILKTRDRLWSRVECRVRELHPYDCPCIVKVTTPQAHRAFADWIHSETRS